MQVSALAKNHSRNGFSEFSDDILFRVAHLEISFNAEELIGLHSDEKIKIAAEKNYQVDDLNFV